MHQLAEAWPRQLETRSCHPSQRRRLLFLPARGSRRPGLPGRVTATETLPDIAVAIARRTAEETAVGDPSDDGRHIGPVVSAAQFDKIQGRIQVGHPI